MRQRSCPSDRGETGQSGEVVEEEVEGEELVGGVRPRGSSGAAPPGRLGLTPVSRLRQSRSLSCCRPSGLWPSSSTTTARSLAAELRPVHESGSVSGSGPRPGQRSGPEWRRSSRCM